MKFSIFSPQFLINYLAVFFGVFLLSLVFTGIVRKLALRFNIIDAPDVERKRHEEAVPLLGGVAVFLSFFIVLYFARAELLSGNLTTTHWLGFFAGGLFLVIGGFWDDKYGLSPGRQLVFPLLASLSVVVGGVEIEKISNPLGGHLYLGGIISSFLIFAWLMGMMYTTKLLDGIDGLVSGITAIGGLVIFLFTMTVKYYQPDIGLAALVLAGASLGFLIWNWHPAKIFLGESGSLFLGYSLGVLAIISGGKIAIALLVMGIPALDLVWTIVRRLLEKKNPFKFADRGHLHFRLSDSGLGAKKTVLVYYFLSAAFGLSALFLQSRGKALALIALIVLMFGLIVFLNYSREKK